MTPLKTPDTRAWSRLASDRADTGLALLIALAAVLSAAAFGVAADEAAARSCAKLSTQTECVARHFTPESHWTDEGGTIGAGGSGSGDRSVPAAAVIGSRAPRLPSSPQANAGHADRQAQFFKLDGGEP